MSKQNIRWSRKSLEELRQFYDDEIRTVRHREGYDPDDRPSARWLQEHGWYSGLEYALRNKHGMTVKEFLIDVVDLEDDESNTGAYQWPVEDDATTDAAEMFIQSLERRELADSTLDSYRSKVATYLDCYQRLHNRPPFGDRLRDRETQPQETERVISVFDTLREDLGTAQSTLSYVNAVQEFYDLLRRRGMAVYDPSSDLRKELGIDSEDIDDGNRPALSPEQVRTLASEAETTEERIIVLGTCAWGLRRSEVAGLHVSQLVLDGNDPHIQFDRRKNGPGTVALIYGIEELEQRLVELGAHDHWNGYVFPSGSSETGHIVPDTVTRRFKRLADRADVTIGGSLARPHAGRRYWYRQYTDVVSQVASRVETVAEEQGSSDEQVVYEKYLNKSDRRQQRRTMMRERLAEVFDRTSSQ